MSVIELYNNTNRTRILGSYLPDGNAFVAKNITTTNLYLFLDAIAMSFVLYSDDLNEDGTAIVDPWGNTYTYTFPGVHNAYSVDISSNGPDGTLGNEDDITNW